MERQADKLLELVKDRNRESRCRVLSFVSGKGGVGKTLIATSFAYTLANTFGKKVLLLDCDIGLGNVHLLLGLDPSKNLKAVLRGSSLKEVIQNIYNFDVVLGFSGIDSLEELESYEAANLLIQIDRVLENYDYVILDNSAGISRFTVNFSRAATETYIVTNPEPTALTDAYAFIKSVYRVYGYTSFKVIVNAVSSRREGFKVFERLRLSVEKFLQFRLKLAGILPYSSRVKDALTSGMPLVHLYPSDPFSLGLRRIVQLETGEVLPEEEESFIKKLIRFLKEGV